MTISTLTVALPVSDLATARDFYRALLVAEPVDPPEPVVFVLNAGARLMLVPSDGFEFVLAGGTVAAPGSSECVLNLPATDRDDVTTIVERARAAGADIVTEPGEQPWGYAAAFRDLDTHLWMVAC